MSKQNNSGSILCFLLVLALLVGGVNIAFFNRSIGATRSIKIDYIGDAIFLKYTESDSYSIDGVENGTFQNVDGTFVFYSDAYTVSPEGDPYSILDQKGNSVGTVNLARREETPPSMEIDLSLQESMVYEIPAECDSIRFYASENSNIEYFTSIKVADRTTPLEIILDQVRILAPDLSPALYSVCDAPITVRVKGDVMLTGGYNPYTVEHMSDVENIFKTTNTAANAYYVCMLSAIGTASSILYGVDYYADMFRGVTALQLNVMENTWGQVENLFNGQDGAPGLNGVMAVQIAGDLSIVGDSDALLYLQGGAGGKGGDGTGALVSTTRGGTGGSGGSALVCGNLANGIGARLTLVSGLSGEGGKGGSDALGIEKGPDGDVGTPLEPKVVLGEEINFKSHS